MLWFVIANSRKDSIRKSTSNGIKHVLLHVLEPEYTFLVCLVMDGVSPVVDRLFYCKLSQNGTQEKYLTNIGKASVYRCTICAFATAIGARKKLFSLHEYYRLLGEGGEKGWVAGVLFSGLISSFSEVLGAGHS